MLGNSVVVVVVVRTRPRAIPLAMITMRKSTYGFPLLSRDKYGALLGGPLGRRSSAINPPDITTKHTSHKSPTYTYTDHISKIPYI